MSGVDVDGGADTVEESQIARGGRPALQGIRVVDFTWIGAGAYVTKMLADHGADVIKIESESRPDQLRLSPPYRDGVRGINRSGYFADRNSSKRSLAVDLKTDAGHEMVADLIRTADVIANNFSPGTMAKLGFSYEAVRTLRQDIVYLDMSMQGQDGPESRYVGYGLTMVALTGLHALTGEPDRPPCGTGTNYPDHVPSPTHALMATLAALRHRRRTGEGAYIDIAQAETMVSVLGPAVMLASVDMDRPSRPGNSHLRSAPHGLYRCSGDDRWIAITAASDEQWVQLADLLEVDEALQRRWATDAERLAEREEVDREVQRHTVRWDRYELMEALCTRGVPAGVVQDAEDVLQRDEQLAARGHWAYLDHPEIGRSVYNAPPFTLSRTPGRPHMPAPMMGQHTYEVLAEELGIEQVALDDLRRRGVIAVTGVSGDDG